jgi:heptosyltransferase-2
MPTKILIVAPAWVGDMVMAQVLFRFLKQQYPDAVIDVVTPKATRALLAYMPEIRHSIPLDIQHKEFGFLKRIKLAWALRKEKYDWAIVLPNSWKSALVPFLAGIKKRTGFRGEMRYVLLNDLFILDKKILPLMIQRFLALGNQGRNADYQHYLPTFFPSKEEITKVIEKYEINKQPIIALCPGAAFGPSKRWPPEYFAQVALKKLSESYRVFIFGSPEDLSAAEKIMALTQNACVNLVGKTNLLEAVNVLSLVEKVVTNDSGLMHIACALQKQGVAIYGSSSPQFTPPLFSGMKILSLNIECSPCFQRECPLGHWRCMKELMPEMVIKNL